MPELPEVETVCRGLAPVLVGQRFLDIEQRRANLRFPFDPDFCARLTGARITALRRRAKYLIADLSTGDCLVMHLGMSGRFLIHASSSKTPDTVGHYIYDTSARSSHDHVVFHLTGGKSVVYNDPRRFGFMLLVPSENLESHALFNRLGVEPLGNQLTAHYLAAKAAGRRSPLKSFLMDQRIVAGLGNIYVCEALHQAKLSPSRSASALALRSGVPSVRCERLVTAIRDVLQRAVDLGGSTLRDYRGPDGDSGNFQETFAVYGRLGARCTRRGCSGTVRRRVQQGRSTFYCGQCQR